MCIKSFFPSLGQVLGTFFRGKKIFRTARLRMLSFFKDFLGLIPNIQFCIYFQKGPVHCISRGRAHFHFARQLESAMDLPLQPTARPPHTLPLVFRTGGGLEMCNQYDLVLLPLNKE